MNKGDFDFEELDRAITNAADTALPAHPPSRSVPRQDAPRVSPHAAAIRASRGAMRPVQPVPSRPVPSNHPPSRPVAPTTRQRIAAPPPVAAQPAPPPPRSRASAPKPAPRPIAPRGRYLDMVSPNSDMRGKAKPTQRPRNIGSYTEYSSQHVYDSHGHEIYENNEIEYGEIDAVPAHDPRPASLTSRYYTEGRTARELRAEEEFISPEEDFDENMFDTTERPAQQRRRVPAPFVDNANEIVDKRPLSPDFNDNRRTQVANRNLQNRSVLQPKNPNPRTDFPEEKRTSKIVSFLVVLAVIVVGAAVGAASYFFFFDR